LTAVHIFSDLKKMTGLFITEISLKALVLFQWWAHFNPLFGVNNE